MALLFVRFVMVAACSFVGRWGGLIEVMVPVFAVGKNRGG